MKDNTILGIAGVISITIVETAALLTGVDGAYLAIAIGAISAIIAGIGGYSLGHKKIE